MDPLPGEVRSLSGPGLSPSASCFSPPPTPPPFPLFSYCLCIWLSCRSMGPSREGRAGSSRESCCRMAPVAGILTSTGAGDTHTIPSAQWWRERWLPCSLSGTQGPFSPAPLLYPPSSRTVIGPARDCVLAAHSTLRKNVPTHTLRVGDS